MVKLKGIFKYRDKKRETEVGAFKKCAWIWWIFLSLSIVYRYPASRKWFRILPRSLNLRTSFSFRANHNRNNHSLNLEKKINRWKIIFFQQLILSRYNVELKYFTASCEISSSGGFPIDMVFILKPAFWSISISR